MSSGGQLRTLQIFRVLTARTYSARELAERFEVSLEVAF